MYDSGLDDPRDNGTDKGDTEGVIDVEFKRSIGVVVSMVWENIHERPHQIQRLSCDIRDLENRADSPRNELCRCVYAILPVLDEYWDFPRSLGFQNLGKLSDSLLENLGRTDIDFGDDYHYRDVESESDPQMLFRHSDQSIIGSDHQKSVIWLRTEESEYSGAKVTFVSSQISEADHFGL